MVRNFLCSFFREISIETSVISNFLVACEEIYVNISQYAYPGKINSVDVECVYIYNNREICVEFIDSGIEFDPTKSVLNNKVLPLEKREPGGLGIFMAKTMSDFMFYKRENGKNILKLFKRIDKKRSDNNEK